MQIKEIITAVVVCLFSLHAGAAGCAGTDSLREEQKTVKTKANVIPTADSLVIIARLTEIPGTFAPNDLYNYVYIMKYRVLSVERGVYTGKEILVGHYNPLIARNSIKDKMDSFVGGTLKEFTVGAKQHLVLTEPVEKIWNGALEDEYFDRTEKRYFALIADPVK